MTVAAGAARRRNNEYCLTSILLRNLLFHQYKVVISSSFTYIILRGDIIIYIFIPMQ